ncbi:multidrug resistance-associated protein 1-like isoform X1 [Argiope bruennichi]|uniref:multidrug resistance-associated protein 1-like isoform X1 n=1 Tax=Argiope bruennichi TaxID=94029 RepID=UPI002494A17D|nr:multidrug resistance-associated protein 1-like isoform X1 [Argiope bruennichi]
MDNFCGESFWDINKTWHAEVPDFSSCFQDIVLVTAPCSLFSLFFLLSLWSLVNRSSLSPLPWTWLNITKSVLSLSLLLINAVWCGILFHENISYESVPHTALLSSSSKVIVYLLVMILMLMHKSRGITTSTLLTIFWIVFSVCGILLHRSALLQYFMSEIKPPSVIFALEMMYYPLIYIQLVLSAFTDKKGVESLKDGNVLDEVSFLSFVSYSWFNEVVFKSRKQILTVSDLSFLSARLTAQHVYKTFSNNWKLLVNAAELHSKSLVWALIKSFWVWIVAGTVLEVFFVFMLFLPPLILDRIIDFVHHDHYSWRGHLFALMIFLTIFIGKIMQNSSIFLLIISGVQLKSALMGAVYRKNLLISESIRKMYSSGTLMNLVSVDVERIEYFTYHCASLISSPIKIIVIIFIMWQYIGPSCLAGVLVMVVSFPIAIYASTVNERYSEEQMEKKDLRLKYMGEILNGIKILKLYAWEIAFSTKVSDSRKAELKLIHLSQLCRVAISFVFFCTPFMVSLASFATYLLVDSRNVLDPTKAFVSLTLMDQLRYALFEIPEALAELIQSKIALERIRKFLITENMNPNIIGSNPEKGETITVKSATFSWGIGSNPTLMDITLRIRRGSLYAVIGPVGSGKSSLISALLGEMHKLSGAADLKGSIAYVPQQAWILNRSVRENILLAKHIREEKYHKILDKCCLRPDLEILPAGDATEIGEKGVNLSGGQKQRISIARAVYQDKDIYLLDDPLSAVDVHVRKSLFDDVIGNEGLLRRKTRILVTHDVSLLHKVDTIITMKDGRIAEIGSYYELLKRGESFTSFVREHTNTKTMEENLKRAPRTRQDSTTSNEDILCSEVSEHSGPLANSAIEPANVKTSEESKRQISRPFSRFLSTEPRTSFDQALSEDNLSMSQKGDYCKENEYKLTEDEKMEIGGVNAQIYWEYVKHAGLHVFFSAMLGYMLFVAFETGGNIWLSEWTAQGLHNGTQDKSSTTTGLSVYGILGFAQAVSVVIGSAILVYGTVKASERYHKNLLASIIRAPMSFFDQTPMGRIMNRFSTDMDIMDIQIYPILDAWFHCLLYSLASFIVIGMNTPIFLVILLPIGVAYYIIQRLNLNTYRQVMRLESTTRSPIYSHFLETIQGVSSICAYKVREEFTKNFEEKLNIHMLCNFNTISCNRWLQFWLDLLGCLIVLIATLLAIQARYTLGPAVVALMITYALSVTDALMWFVRTNSELENKIISIERLDEYCRLKSEAPWFLTHDNFYHNWPQRGNIDFYGYSTRYAEGLDLVLKDVNLHIESHEKVGIVGRTGAGKSSITMALFRIIEPVQGSIVIDNIDITTVGLHCLRSKLTIIPQDPVVFTGTLRMNVDPNNEYKDEDIWESLDKAHLKTFVSNLSEGLEYDLEEGGTNFSAGQRQLLCLARALLKKTKILVLDEATASVDMDTDSLIQNTIRTAFNNDTVITIAHRLNTIIDYDKIVVMESGSIREVGNPKILLKDPDSTFYQMCKDAGLI